MSYQNMDHAGWVARDSKIELTEFQAKVCDILGMVFGGIYNAPINWRKVDWKYGGDGVSVVVSDNRFSTWDFDALTRLVFLCHEARIRCELSVVAFRYLRLSFWQRAATGDISRRHPNLAEAVQAFREYLPPDHRIIYGQPERIPEKVC